MLAGNKEIAALRYVCSCMHVHVMWAFSSIIICRLIHHPNLVSLFGYTMSNTELMLIMNFVDGENLDSLIFGRAQVISKAYTQCLVIYNYCYQCMQMTPQERLLICSSIANGIEYMHTRNSIVVHRDIKPQNVMVRNCIDTYTDTSTVLIHRWLKISKVYFFVIWGFLTSRMCQRRLWWRLPVTRLVPTPPELFSKGTAEPRLTYMPSVSSWSKFLGRKGCGEDLMVHKLCRSVALSRVLRCSPRLHTYLPPLVKPFHNCCNWDDVITIILTISLVEFMIILF